MGNLLWKIKWNRFALAYEIKSKVLDLRIKMSRVKNRFRKLFKHGGSK